MTAQRTRTTRARAARRHGGVLAVGAIVQTAVLLGVPVGTGSALSSSNGKYDFTAYWQAVDFCTGGWCKGANFPGFFDLHQNGGRLTGRNGVNPVVGTASGRSAGFTSTYGSYVAHFHVTMSQDRRSFKGGWTDSEGGSGYTLATRSLPADHLTIVFTPSTVDASGTGVATATITALDPTNTPVVGDLIHIEPPLIYGGANPPALVCDASGRLVSPIRLSGGSLDGLSFDRTTDSAGQINLTLFIGATAGEWPLDAFEKGPPAGPRVFGVLNVGPAGGAAGLPPELTSLLAAAADSSLANFSVSAQRTALAWLGGVARPSGALQGVAFAPIYAVDALGKTNPGVVLYADSPAVRQEVLSYLAGSGPAPSDLQAVVIDAKLMSQLLIGSRIAGQNVNVPPYRLPSLDEWANGGFITIQDPTLQSRNKGTQVPVPAHGQPRFGLVGATGYEDLLYGYGPYPPFAASAQLQAQFTRCVGTGVFATTVVPHSPVRIEAHGPGATVAGIDAHGHATDTIPDAIVDYNGSKLTSIHLPRATYRLTITGTGTGPATIVITTPTPAGAQTRVFSFPVRRGQTGTLALPSAGAPGKMRWGNSTVRAGNGLRLAIRGLPATLRPHRVTQLRVKVIDQFGQSAVGVSMTASGHPLSAPLSAFGPSGTIIVPIDPVGRGTIHLRLSGVGYETLNLAVSVR